MKKTSRGFTILELMIAITILSVILLISSLVLVNIGNVFSKGANLAKVQDDNRNIISNLTSAIEFSGAQLTSNTYTYTSDSLTVSSYCFGDIRYSYVVGFPSSDPNPPHILWVDEMSNSDTCWPLDLGDQDLNSASTNFGCDSIPVSTCAHSTNGSDLIAADMHLSDFSIQSTTSPSNLYEVSVGLAVGDIDMFEGYPGTLTLDNGEYICNPVDGQQYCATSYLTTWAVERVTSG